MSIFSNTQGTPRRVYALLRLVAALGEASTRATIEAMMTAKSDPAEDSRQGGSSAFVQTLGVARDLGLVLESDGNVGLSPHGCPQTYGAFADMVHGRLTSSEVREGDDIALDVFAYVAHRSDKERGPHWFMSMERGRLADTLRDFIDASREGVGTFNPTRLPPWQKWTEFLGLTVEMDNGRPFPEISTRLAREIASDDDLRPGEDIAASDFLDRILKRMPYLPGGARSLRLNGPPATGVVSDLLSAALRDLEADDVIYLEAVGDSGNAATLSPDEVRPAKAFNIVRIACGGSAP